jgi:hypothetical protein
VEAGSGAGGRVAREEVADRLGPAVLPDLEVLPAEIGDKPTVRSTTVTPTLTRSMPARNASTWGAAARGVAVRAIPDAAQTRSRTGKAHGSALYYMRRTRIAAERPELDGAYNERLVI